MSLKNRKAQKIKNKSRVLLDIYVMSFNVVIFSQLTAIEEVVSDVFKRKI